MTTDSRGRTYWNVEHPEARLRLVVPVRTEDEARALAWRRWYRNRTNKPSDDPYGTRWRVMSTLSKAAVDQIRQGLKSTEEYKHRATSLRVLRLKSTDADESIGDTPETRPGTVLPPSPSASSGHRPRGACPPTTTVPALAGRSTGPTGLRAVALRDRPRPLGSSLIRVVGLT